MCRFVRATPGCHLDSMALMRKKTPEELAEEARRRAEAEEKEARKRADAQEKEQRKRSEGAQRELKAFRASPPGQA